MSSNKVQVWEKVPDLKKYKHLKKSAILHNRVGAQLFWGVVSIKCW